MANRNDSAIMEHPFPKSLSLTEKVKRLVEIVTPEDILGILINADPDSIASAMALKRLYWRKVKKISLFHINKIKRLDNLLLIKLLKLEMSQLKNLNNAEVTKWAILDSQPSHNEMFDKYDFDIVIDHHPYIPGTRARFMEIKEDYGANSTIMTEYLRAAKIRPSSKLATALFYGIKTDTGNFTRHSMPNDLNAFRYLFQFANLNIIKKIESSELSKRNLDSFHLAVENLIFIKDRAFIHMDKVNDPDILVIIADFFLKMAEATWSIVSGIYNRKVIVIFRNAGFRLDAGKMAHKLFGQIGSAGGHKSAARAEIQLQQIGKGLNNTEGIRQFILDKVKKM